LTGKKAIFRGFFLNVPQKKINIFYTLHLNTFKRRILNTISLCSTRGFNFFLTHCPVLSVGQNQLKSLKVGSRFQFTREIALNDKNVSQYFTEPKVLRMTLKQLFKIFIPCLIA